MPTLRKHVPGVLGSFVHLDAATEAITTLRSRGFRKLTVYTATPNHEVEEALEHKTSPVRLFTLIGGLTGCAGGFGMTLWMSTDWPVLTGGKPIPTVTPFVVIAFELTILLGALATLFAVALFSLLKANRRILYDPAYSNDQIGIFVPAAPAQLPVVEQMLRDAGAVEVRHDVA